MCPQMFFLIFIEIFTVARESSANVKYARVLMVLLYFYSIVLLFESEQTMI